MRCCAQGTGKECASAPCIAKIGFPVTNAATVCSDDSPRSQGASQIGQESHASAKTTITAGGMRKRAHKLARPEMARTKKSSTSVAPNHSTQVMAPLKKPHNQ